MFENLISALKAEKRTIVFTEGEDARILEAASRLKKDGLMDSILVGNVEAVKAAAAKGGFDIEGMEIIDPATYSEMDAMVAKMVELRKGKMSAEDCKAALAKGNYFGTMLVKMGKADALLGGATYSTADTVRPALQLIKTKPGAHLVSSCFILVREKDGVEEKLAMGDCAINIDYPDSVDKEGNVTLKGSQNARRQLEAERGRPALQLLRAGRRAHPVHHRDGLHPFLMARILAMASTAPAAPNKWPVMDLVELMFNS